MFKHKSTKILTIILLCFSFLLSACVSDNNGGGEPVDPNVNSQTIFEVNETAKPFISSKSSQYSIVIPNADYVYTGSASNYNVLAADELVYFLNQATGCTLNVVSDNGLTLDNNSKYISLGETSLFEQSNIEIDKEKLGDSGYIIRTVGDSIFVCGPKKLGSLFGVYELLKHFVSYEYYSYDEIYFDKVSSLNLLDFNVIDIPSFEHRYLSSSMYSGEQNAFVRYRNSSPFIPGLGMHNSFILINPTIYKKKHPDWFAVDANGNSVNQLNYTAGEALVNEVVKKLTVYLEDTYDPEVYLEETKYLFFGQEDYNVWDKRDESLRLYNKYGTNAASLILFVNQVADKIKVWVDENQPGREVIITTFAYWQTLDAPVKKENGEVVRDKDGNIVLIDESVKLRDNVCVRIAPLQEMNYFESFNHEDNKKVKDNLEAWAALGNVQTYLYSNYFCDQYVNVNNFESLQENYKFVRDLGSKVCYDQYLSTCKNSPAFTHYRAYLQTKLMWNVDANVEEITNNFFENYYRDAADIMKQYMLEIKMVYKDRYPKLNMQIDLNAGIFSISSLWDKGTLLKWMGYMNKAFSAIEKYEKSNPELYAKLKERITHESLSIRYLLIELYGSIVYTPDELYLEKVEVLNLLKLYDMQPTNARMRIDDTRYGFVSLKDTWGV